VNRCIVHIPGIIAGRITAGLIPIEGNVNQFTYVEILVKGLLELLAREALSKRMIFDILALLSTTPKLKLLLLVV